MQKRLKHIFSADISEAGLILGYILGLIAPFILGLPVYSDVLKSGVSPFLCEDISFVRTLCIQAIYPTVIFLIGFIPCSRIFAFAVILLRAYLAAYSSVSIAFYCRASGIYLVHALSSAAAVLICWSVSKCALDARQKSSLYTLKFLFFSGILLIILFLRAIALAFV